MERLPAAVLLGLVLLGGGIPACTSVHPRGTVDVPIPLPMFSEDKLEPKVVEACRDFKRKRGESRLREARIIAKAFSDGPTLKGFGPIPRQAMTRDQLVKLLGPPEVESFGADAVYDGAMSYRLGPQRRPSRYLWVWLRGKYVFWIFPLSLNP